MNKTSIAQQPKVSSFIPHSQSILQRKCACGNHTTAGGECAECAKKKMGLQRKLAIGASNDPLEQEADRVADHVMAVSAHSVVSAAPPRIQRFTGQANRQMDIALVSVDRVLSDSGRPLEPALQQDMEQRFGHNFSQVRVHSDGAAAQSARDVNALAYTVGRHIVFGVGAPMPSSSQGMHLLAHELTHVVQQSRGGAEPGLEGDPALERDANQAADSLVGGRPINVSRASGIAIAREPTPQSPPSDTVIYEVDFPDGKKRLTAEEFANYKARAIQKLRIDLKRVADFAEVGRQSQVDMLKDYHGGVESLGDVIRKPKSIIGIASDIWGNTTPPYLGMWSHAKSVVAHGLEALDRGDLKDGARLLRQANQHYRDAMHEWNTYREKTIGGAESLASDLEIVRDVSFAVALAAGAAVAAPIVAGGAAALGATGATATALTAGGAAIATGGGGVVLGGGSTALGSYASDGKVDWKATKRDAAKFGKQGAVTGLTAGLGSALGGAGKVAELSKPLAQQAVRRCLTESGINVAGEITSEALDRLMPSASAEQVAEAKSKELLPAPVRSALIGCVGGALGVPAGKLRGGSATVVDKAVGAGIAYGDARLQGRTNEEALAGAAQSMITSHLVGLGKRGTDAAAQKAAIKPRLGADTAEEDTTAKALSPLEENATNPIHKLEGKSKSAVDKNEATATKPTANGHEIVVTRDGVGVCSPSPCPVIHVEYAKELAENPELNNAYKRVQAAREKNPKRAAELSDTLIRNLERIRANTASHVMPPNFATLEQRARLEQAIETAQKIVGGNRLKTDELNAHLRSAKTPAELDSIVGQLEAQVERTLETHRDLGKTEQRTGDLEGTDATHTTTKPRTRAMSHERALGVGMEKEGGAIPLDHDRHHVAPKRGGGEVGDRILELLRISDVPIDDPANGIPLAGQARDPRAVHESSEAHSKVHKFTDKGEYLPESNWMLLLQDLETVRGDADGTKAMLRKHGQNLFEGRERKSQDFRLGPDFEPEE